MSVRYKSALLSLVSLAAIYGRYFAHVWAGAPDAPRLLAVTIVTIALVQIVGHAIIAGTSPDRYGPKDEHERSIDRRATAIGYYLLIAGAICAAASVRAGLGRTAMANAILLAIVVAECVRQGAFLTLHHRAL